MFKRLILIASLMMMLVFVMALSVPFSAVAQDAAAEPTRLFLRLVKVQPFSFHSGTV